MCIIICISVDIILKLLSLECVSINYLHCRLVEGVKIFPVCVIDQLSDHFVWS